MAKVASIKKDSFHREIGLKFREETNKEKCKFYHRTGHGN
jgi:hypothetical protein